MLATHYVSPYINDEELDIKRRDKKGEKK